MLPQKRPEDLRRIRCFTLVDGLLCTLLLGGGALRLVVTKAGSEELRKVVDIARRLALSKLILRTGSVWREDMLSSSSFKLF
jgi:hypothetical protein